MERMGREGGKIQKEGGCRKGMHNKNIHDIDVISK